RASPNQVNSFSRLAACRTWFRGSGAEPLMPAPAAASPAERAFPGSGRGPAHPLRPRRRPELWQDGDRRRDHSNGKEKDVALTKEFYEEVACCADADELGALLEQAPPPRGMENMIEAVRR